MRGLGVREVRAQATEEAEYRGAKAPVQVREVRGLGVREVREGLGGRAGRAAGARARSPAAPRPRGPAAQGL